mmetsp:Transcript_20466/g.38637  ORF Transcript_20466/g.38637 Transcript_20466/m.38637 type:complete len:116 (+) Transcript_20466:292-639(+)
MVPRRTPIAILAVALPAVLFIHVQQRHLVTAFSPTGAVQLKVHRPRRLHQRVVQYHQNNSIASSFASTATTSLCLSSSDIQAKLKAQMAKLQERDRSSKAISPDVSTLVFTSRVT